MKKVAVIIAPGFEEGEALTIVDILRRGQIQCDTIGFEKEVQGGQNIVFRCDSVLNESLLDYDMVVL
ncbi:MAG: DJ-1/PfpI family protein, partial [Faecalibacillus faecis]